MSSIPTDELDPTRNPMEDEQIDSHLQSQTHDSRETDTGTLEETNDTSTAATPTYNPQTASPLFKLPAELRNGIYSHALSLSADLTWEPTRWATHYTENLHPVFSACKRLHHEASPFAYHTLRLIYPVERPMRIWQALTQDAQHSPMRLVTPHVRVLQVYIQESRFVYFTKFAAQVDAVQAFIDRAPRLEKVLVRVDECDCRLWRYAGGGRHAPGCENGNVMEKLKRLKASCGVDVAEGNLSGELDDFSDLDAVAHQTDALRITAGPSVMASVVGS